MGRYHKKCLLKGAPALAKGVEDAPVENGTLPPPRGFGRAAAQRKKSAGGKHFTKKEVLEKGVLFSGTSDDLAEQRLRKNFEDAIKPMLEAGPGASQLAARTATRVGKRGGFVRVRGGDCSTNCGTHSPRKPKTLA